MRNIQQDLEPASDDEPAVFGLRFIDDALQESVQGVYGVPRLLGAGHPAGDAASFGPLAGVEPGSVNFASSASCSARRLRRTMTITFRASLGSRPEKARKSWHTRCNSNHNCPRGCTASPCGAYSPASDVSW